jgi:hypothetical protein
LAQDPELYVNIPHRRAFPSAKTVAIGRHLRKQLSMRTDVAAGCQALRRALGARCGEYVATESILQDESNPDD